MTERTIREELKPHSEGYWVNVLGCLVDILDRRESALLERIERLEGAATSHRKLGGNGLSADEIAALKSMVDDDSGDTAGEAIIHAESPSEPVDPLRRAIEELRRMLHWPSDERVIDRVLALPQWQDRARPDLTELRELAKQWQTYPVIHDRLTAILDRMEGKA